MQSEEPKIVGSAYGELKSLVRKYAQKDLPILFVGDTGVGKEIFAKLYFASTPRTGKKLTVNCAGHTEQLLRSEVFGHVKGAFTDAVTKHDGHLKSCDKGILFLDELGDASPEFQAAILRVSEGNRFTPLGSDEEIEVNTLIIAATNRPARIREDLKQRFHFLPVPPLQKFDIPVMVSYFLGKKLKEDMLQELMSRDYRGNVRELKRLCERLEAEKGEAIFSKKDPGRIIETGTFDYERFRFEYHNWEQYIAPILLEHKLSYRYKYFPPKPSPDTKIEEDSWPLGARIARDRHPNWKPPDPGIPMAEIVERLLTGRRDEKTLRDFIALLDNCFMDGTLPLLLKSTDRYIGHSGQTQTYKPDLSPLLNLKWKEALEKFKAEYLSYYLRIHKQNRGEAAKGIGMKRDSLDSALRRLQSTSKTTLSGKP